MKVHLAFAAAVLAFVLVLWFILSYPRRSKSSPKIFGATYMTMDNDYFVTLNSAIKEVVESKGDVLVTRDPAQNQSKQNEEIIDMLNMGARFIFLNPVDWKTITPALEECRKRKVPFIVVDTDIFDQELAASVIVSDNYLAGVQVADDLMKKRNSAKIVMLYDNQISSMRNRIKGFIDRLNEKNYDYDIVFESRNTSIPLASMARMQEFLELKIDFDVVLGANDPTALGALAAMRKNRKNKGVLVYGIDGSPSSKKMISMGSVEASSAQFPKIVGRTAVDLAYSFLDGEEISSRVVIPVELITKESIDRFTLLGWE